LVLDTHISATILGGADKRGVRSPREGDKDTYAGMRKFSIGRSGKLSYFGMNGRLTFQMYDADWHNTVNIDVSD
jgi:hypothetical protein